MSHLQSAIRELYETEAEFEAKIGHLAKFIEYIEQDSVQLTDKQHHLDALAPFKKLSALASPYRMEANLQASLADIVAQSESEQMAAYMDAIIDCAIAYEHYGSKIEPSDHANDITKVFDAFSRPSHPGLTYTSFLVQAAQRMPRYQMLLDAIISQSKGAAEQPGLQAALEKQIEFNKTLNEKLGDQTNIEVRLHRKTLVKITKKGEKNIEGFLIEVSKQGSKYDKLFKRPIDKKTYFQILLPELLRGQLKDEERAEIGLSDDAFLMLSKLNPRACMSLAKSLIDDGQMKPAMLICAALIYKENLALDVQVDMALAIARGYLSGNLSKRNKRVQAVEYIEKAKAIVEANMQILSDSYIKAVNAVIEELAKANQQKKNAKMLDALAISKIATVPQPIPQLSGEDADSSDEELVASALTNFRESLILSLRQVQKVHEDMQMLDQVAQVQVPDDVQKELERLRAENETLRAENAALVDQQKAQALMLEPTGFRDPGSRQAQLEAAPLLEQAEPKAEPVAKKSWRKRDKAKFALAGLGFAISIAGALAAVFFPPAIALVATSYKVLAAWIASCVALTVPSTSLILHAAIKHEADEEAASYSKDNRAEIEVVEANAPPKDVVRKDGRQSPRFFPENVSDDYSDTINHKPSQRPVHN